jgi:hypothetical protein
MKNRLLVPGITILLMAIAFESSAQPSLREDRKMLAKNSGRTTAAEKKDIYKKQFTPKQIEVSFDEVTYVSFGKQKITELELSTDEVLIKKINNNKDLKLIAKTDHPKFKESSLTVVAGGNKYLFKVKYAKLPKKTVYAFTAEDAYVVTNSEENDEESKESATSVSYAGSDDPYRKKSPKEIDEIAKACRKIIDTRADDLNHDVSNGRIHFLLKQVYIYDNKLFFHVKFDNNSNIAYDIDLMRFSVENKKKSKTKVVQDRKLIPLYIHNTETHINGMQKNFIKIFVFNKFTIDAKTKLLLIESWERDGDRNLQIKLSSDVILDATVLR